MLPQRLEIKTILILKNAQNMSLTPCQSDQHVIMPHSDVHLSHFQNCHGFIRKKHVDN